ncbi:hypothetical protein EV715DRAFT_298213 [Schizophyllum commune]
MSRRFQTTLRKLSDEIDGMSMYEFKRQEEISRVQSTLRAELASQGLLTRGDPLWGEVTPRILTPPPDCSSTAPTPPPNVDLGTLNNAGAIPNCNSAGRAVRAGAALGDADAHPTGRGTTVNRDNENLDYDDATGDHVNTSGLSNSVSSPADIDKGRRDAVARPVNNTDPFALSPPPRAESDDDHRVDDAEHTQASHEQDAPARGGRQGVDERSEVDKGGRMQGHTRPRQAKSAGSAGATGPRSKHHAAKEAQQETGGDANRSQDLSQARRGKKRSHDDAVKNSVFEADRSSWDDWFALAVDNLALENVVPASAAKGAWDKLATTWWAWERRNGYQEGKRVPTARKRPSEIGEWIKRARKPDYAPTHPESQPREDFVDDWRSAMWAWWSAVNPKSRPRDKSGRVGERCEPVDWADLRCHGPNGLLSVLKGLKWWFDMECEPEGGAEWRAIVGDVQYALDGLLSQFQEDETRSAKPLPTSPPPYSAEMTVPQMHKPFDPSYSFT